MALPAPAPFPPASLRKEVLREEWGAFLDAWIILSEAYLQLPDGPFRQSADSLSNFLVSFFHEIAEDSGSSDVQIQKEGHLRRLSWLLCHRSLSQDPVPEALLQWTFLADLSHALHRSNTLAGLFQGLWKRKSSHLEATFQKAKSALITKLESKNLAEAETLLTRLAPLFRASPDVARKFMTGSDLVDSLANSYVKASPVLRRKLTAFTYAGLQALTKGEKPNYSLLSDHIYSLKANNETLQKSQQQSLISDIVTNTPLTTKFRDTLDTTEGNRARTLLSSLDSLRQPAMARPKKLVRRKIDKGKRPMSDEYGHGAFGGEVHIHQMSLITQIQDLFPHLGSGYIVKLLDECNDNVEQVTAHLLDGSLPSHLENLDPSEQLPQPSSSGPTDQTRHLEFGSTPPFTRRNIHDNDELDNLTVSASKLHFGRANTNGTADDLLADRTTAPNKAAILSALAVFDSDDDERDDTYDIADVGGTIDTSAGDDADADLRDNNEEALFRAFRMSPDAFGRDAATRRGKARTALRSETGMTDEAIEGWAVMVGRDPRRLRRLEAKFNTFAGQQNEVGRTAYRESPGGSEGEAEGSGIDAPRGGFRGRGGGRGGRGGVAPRRGGGNVAGPSGEQGTDAARRGKEASKGRRANHNRRNQRAKKVARAGFLG
ncbi:hypothetical protein K402DRAFT_385342 [Aulographum hederae CBS 113979]|uniref:CUE domain-containing protein n=1 Tax=Aulographum hederae CBS 113979 TaxID=1176131 RepID=A0A6G1GMQ4_9PEZI|nr:hypothetical protein K402DRAFT_385342 [Aulographum hederae CBS 113979]